MAGRQDDGHSTTISFSDNATIKFYEKEVQPPGVEGGGANDTTTMLNLAWRTRSPKKLKTLTDSSLVVAYAPEVYPEVVAMLNTNQAITITFPDASTLVFWGWLDGFVPGNQVEGEQPTADCTIIPSNQDAAGAEIAPVHT